MSFTLDIRATCVYQYRPTGASLSATASAVSPAATSLSSGLRTLVLFLLRHFPSRRVLQQLSVHLGSRQLHVLDHRAADKARLDGLLRGDAGGAPGEVDARKGASGVGSVRCGGRAHTMCGKFSRSSTVTWSSLTLRNWSTECSVPRMARSAGRARPSELPQWIGRAGGTSGRHSSARPPPPCPRGS